MNKVDWEFKGEVMNDVPENAYGFIYMINYNDGTYYIGKKNFYSNRTMNPLANGKNRDNGSFFQKIINRKRTTLESVKSESKWREYNGSSENIVGLEIVSKQVLKICYDAINLTYGELEWLVKLDVLIDDKNRNGNIIGKFFRGKIK